MLKRPLNSRFREPVLRDEKTTTIRDKAWPVGVPIMLYNWSGPAYRSKQIDVAPVVVKGFWTIRITHKPGGEMAYECGKTSGPALHESEGFASQAEMDEWFRALVWPGQTIEKTLMLFSRSNNKICPLAHLFAERRGAAALTRMKNKAKSGEPAHEKGRMVSVRCGRWLGPARRNAASPRNSMCGSARLADLDWSHWWTDGSGGELYLHVRRLHPDMDGTDSRDATWHRVFCRQTDKPRLTVIAGELFWLIDRPNVAHEPRP